MVEEVHVNVVKDIDNLCIKDISSKERQTERKDIRLGRMISRDKEARTRY